MVRYILKKMFHGFWVLLGVVMVVFLIFDVLPGDPLAMVSGVRNDIANRQVIAKELGLYEPVPTRLYLYLRDLSPVSIHEDTEKEQQKYNYTPLFSVGSGNVLVLKTPYLRRSFENNQLVSQIISERIGNTLWLAVSSMLFATLFGVLLGILSGLRQGSWIDHTMVSMSVFGTSIPSYVVALLVAIVFGHLLSDYTGLGITGDLYVSNNFEEKHLELKNLILPAFALSLRPLAIITQLTRSSMIEVLSQDYIRTARAKGMSTNEIIFKHALKNALNPVITSVSSWLATLMAGAYFIEIIFDFQGLGYKTIKAVENQDFPVVMGVTLFVGFTFIMINIFVDILYAIIDPRVRVK